MRGTDTEHVLVADAVGKRFGKRWALRDCSVALPAGNVTALVGPNGAGKSTFLHLTVGLSRPDAGGMRVLGADPYENITVLADLGFVAQDTPVYRDFTADELVVMGGKLNRRWDAQLARNRLAQLGIPPRKQVGRLSGGVTGIVRERHTDRQSTLLVRTSGAISDPLWTVQEPTLEDIILDHLARRDERATYEEWGAAA